MLNIYWNNEQACNTLMEFKQKYDNKIYKNKLDYSVWRKIKTLSESVITLSKAPVSIKIEHKDGVIYLPLNDNGFADFIYDKYFIDVRKCDNNEKNERKSEKMKSLNFDFGPITNNDIDIRMSIYGLALRNAAREWVSYNPKTKQIINVDVFNFDGKKFLFKMPVAVKDVAVGDVIMHLGVPMFIIDIDENGSILAVDVTLGEEKRIIPTSNMFGFNFITKVISFVTAIGDAPSPDAPFGNFLPFLMMGDTNEDLDPMLMFMMMQQNGTAQPNGNFFSNPLLLYMMTKEKDMKDSSFLLPLLMTNSLVQNK